MIWAMSLCAGQLTAQSEPSDELDNVSDERGCCSATTVPVMHALRVSSDEIEIDGEDTRVLAANLESIESDLTTLDPVELAAKISPREVETFTSGVSEPASAEQSERAQGLWRYFAVALVLLLIGETFLSNRTRGRMA